MFSFLIYELSAFVLSMALAKGVLKADIRLSEFLCLAVSLKLLATSLVPFVVTLLGANSPSTYLLISAAFVAVSALILFRRDEAGVWSSERSPLGAVIATAAVVVFCAMVGIAKAGPFSETDSLVNFSYVLEWARNAKSPYFMAYYYSSLWEMNFVPAVVLKASDAVLWWPSAQAIFLLGSATYLLCRELAASRYLAVLVLAAVMTLPVFIGVSGYGTLKNDMIYAAGGILLVLGLIGRQARNSRSAIVFVVAGISFLSVKYSGPVYTALVLMVWLALGIGDPTTGIVRRLRFAAVAGLASLAIGGHYYLKNIAVFGNPIFPYPATIGPVVLRGEPWLPTSSLLTRASEVPLWMEFLKSPAYGLAAPVAVMVGVACAIFLMLRGVRKSSRNEAQVLIAFAALIGWLIYVGSIFSDWLGPNLVSLRYATSAITFTFICLAVAVPMAGRAGRVLARALLAWCAASQAASVLTIVYRADPTLTRLALMTVSCALVALAFGPVLLPRRWRLVALGSVIAACMIAGLAVSEINRTRYWLTEWKPIVSFVSGDRDGERIYLVAGSKELQPLPFKTPPEYDGLSPVRYPLVGPKFQNTVEAGPLADLVSQLKSGRRFDAIAVVAWNGLDRPLLERVRAQVAPYGYSVADSNELAARFASN